MIPDIQKYLSEDDLYFVNKTVFSPYFSHCSKYIYMEIQYKSGIIATITLAIGSLKIKSV
jgi:hypothetical protein